MTAEELKAKRLALGFRSRNALAKALGVSKYAVEHWEYGRRAIPGLGASFSPMSGKIGRKVSLRMT